MEELLQKMLEEIEEYGELHEDNCSTLQEDECDCDMKGMKPFVTSQMEKLNMWWVEMAQAHRKHCSPEGNKILTRMMGKNNRKMKDKK